jgi:hypothetical protein
MAEHYAGANCAPTHDGNAKPPSLCAISHKQSSRCGHKGAEVRPDWSQGMKPIRESGPAMHGLAARTRARA